MTSVPPDDGGGDSEVVAVVTVVVLVNGVAASANIKYLFELQVRFAWKQLHFVLNLSYVSNIQLHVAVVSSWQECR